MSRLAALKRRVAGSGSRHSSSAPGQQEAVEDAHAGVEHGADLGRLGLDVGVEDRAADDARGRRQVISALTSTSAPRSSPRRRRSAASTIASP